MIRQLVDSLALLISSIHVKSQPDGLVPKRTELSKKNQGRSRNLAVSTGWQAGQSFSAKIAKYGGEEAQKYTPCGNLAQYHGLQKLTGDSILNFTVPMQRRPPFIISNYIVFL